MSELDLPPHATDWQEDHRTMRIALLALETKVALHLQHEAEVVRLAVRDAMTLHEEAKHHPSMQQMTGLTPGEIVEEYLQSRPLIFSNQTGIERLVDVMEGPPVEHLDGTLGPDREESKSLLGKVDSIQAELKNGVKHSLEITKLQYGLAAGVITALGAIAVALITGG